MATSVVVLLRQAENHGEVVSLLGLTNDTRLAAVDFIRPVTPDAKVTKCKGCGREFLSTYVVVHQNRAHLDVVLVARS